MVLRSSSLPSITPEAEAELESLKQLIKSSHENVDDDSIQEKALQESIAHISRHSPQRHLFCDRLMYPASIHLLILFSFGENSASQWYQAKVEESLNSCTKCMSLFQRGRAKLKQTFLMERKVDPANVNQFSDIILSWEAQRLLVRLRTLYDDYKERRASDPKTQVPREVLYGIAECLCGPGILRLNQELRSLFDEILYKLLATEHPFIRRATTITPGILYLLFDGNDAQKKWCFKILEGLFDESNLTKQLQIQPDVLEEFEIHFLKIQDPAFFTDRKCELFHRNIYPILRLYDPETLLNRLNIPEDIEIVRKNTEHEVHSLIRLIQSHIMAYLNEPLPYILRTFTLVLKKIGDKYWTNITPYTFHNVMDTITANPNFLKQLVFLPNSPRNTGEVNPDAHFDDLLLWIDPMIETLETSQQQQSFNRLSLYFITQVESQNSIPLDSKALLFLKTCELMSHALTFKAKLYSPSFKGELLLRSDARLVVTTKLVRFMDYATAKAIFYLETDKLNNSKVQSASIDVITKSLRFDTLNFAQRTYDSLNNLPSSGLAFSSELFVSLLKQDLSTHTEFSYQILLSLDNVSSVIALSKTNEREVLEFFGYVREFFVKFSDMDSKDIKSILSDAKSLKGYVSCVFSSNTDVYQSAVDILYETFDAMGRLEGVHSLLENNIEACISAVNDNLTNLLFIRSFEPCPRAVGVISDVIDALNSPINGLFGYSDNWNDQTKAAISTFWNKCWRFLDLIYVETIKWANTYSDLVEFTRDTLDLSHAVLACFKTINSFQSTVDAKHPFTDITNTFPDMLVWLRLSDPGLLASCVKLISTTVDLALEFSVNFDERVIELLARYGSRAKKFNNKLTQQQSEEILLRAKSFNAELVEKIVLESESYRNQKTATVESKSASGSSESTPQPRANVPKGQLKITNFGSLSRTAPAAPPKQKFPQTAIERARVEIRSKKIHPPAPLGFNSRRKTKNKESDDSSDEDEDEDDDVRSLFNLKKKAKEAPGVTLLNSNLVRPKRAIQIKKTNAEENFALGLTVDLRPLYQKVLKWSYKRNDDFPDSEHDEITPVADEYSTPDDYIKVYEPLLMLECWQAITSAKSRNSESPIKLTVGSKSTVGDFLEVYCSISKSELVDSKLSDSDLVVIALCEKENTQCTVKEVDDAKTTCFGKIHEIKHAKGNTADITIRVTRSASVNNTILPASSVLILRIMQMTTIEREFSALYGLRYYGLSNRVLSADSEMVSSFDQTNLKQIQNAYSVNESQAKAIDLSVNNPGFSLIQGPPGTGKTKTILGIIGQILSTPGTIGDSSVSSKSKILVCAPSNAAVDELVLRLKDGVKNSSGDEQTVNIVRLGRSDAINSSVKNLTLEELVEARLGKPTAAANNMDSLHKQLDKLKKEMEACKVKISELKNKPPSKELTAELDKFHTERRTISLKANQVKKSMDEEREKQNYSYRNREINRRNIQASILNSAQLICATLSGSAHDILANLRPQITSVIIDEACQCTELSAIIPLRYGSKRCIMVGDPNQLPPTVLSSVAAQSNYDQSLFVRMAKKNKPLLLNVQYRMNSEISRFPSFKFYDSELKDGPDNDRLTSRPWHKETLLSPYKFYDIIEGQQTQNSKTFSYTNRTEVDIAIELIHKLFSSYRSYDFRNKIGIITPYKEQNRLLQQIFVKEFGNSIKAEINFNTIDGFQGQEKEIIIMSCVRADSNSSSVGFLKDFRRMNVALTRPKCSLWILGNQENLAKNTLWYDLISDANKRGVLTKAVKGFTKGKVPQIHELHRSTPKHSKSIHHGNDRYKTESTSSKTLPTKSSGPNSTSRSHEQPPSSQSVAKGSSHTAFTDQVNDSKPKDSRSVLNNNVKPVPRGPRVLPNNNGSLPPQHTQFNNNRSGQNNSNESPSGNTKNFEGTQPTLNKGPEIVASRSGTLLPKPTSSSNLLSKPQRSGMVQGQRPKKRPQSSVFLSSKRKKGR